MLLALHSAPTVPARGRGVLSVGTAGAGVGDAGLPMAVDRHGLMPYNGRWGIRGTEPRGYIPEEEMTRHMICFGVLSLVVSVVVSLGGACGQDASPVDDEVGDDNGCAAGPAGAHPGLLALLLLFPLAGRVRRRYS